MACKWCEELPEQLSENATLYFAAPIAATESAILDVCEARNLRVHYPVDGVCAVDGTSEALGELCVSGLSELGPIERQGTRVLMGEQGKEVGVSDLLHMDSLEKLIARLEGREITSLLRDSRLTTWFQPIVSLSNPEEAFAYEGLARGYAQDGTLISPGRMFSLSRKADLLFYLDRAARISAIEAAAGQQLTERIFINFNPSSIYSPQNCLATTLEAITRLGIAREQIVFEVVESDNVEESEHLKRILEYYRQMGFKVALDDLGAGFNSLTSLNELRPDYIKIDLELIRDVDNDPFKARIADNLLTLSNDLAIPSVVEGIETFGEFEWVRTHGATYAQGFLFGRPSEKAQPPHNPLLEPTH